MSTGTEDVADAFGLTAAVATSVRPTNTSSSQPQHDVLDALFAGVSSAAVPATAGASEHHAAAAVALRSEDDKVITATSPADSGQPSSSSHMLIEMDHQPQSPRAVHREGAGSEEGIGVPEEGSPSPQRLLDACAADAAIAASNSGSSGAFPSTETQPPQRSRAVSVATSATRQLMTPPVHIKLVHLKDGTVPVPTGGASDLLPGGRSPELPSVLQMPTSLRCEFCIKFDSVCFQCHRKWTKLMAERRANLARYLGQQHDNVFSLLVLTTAARGYPDFLDILAAPPSSAQRVAGAFGCFNPLLEDDERGQCSPLIRTSGFVFPLHIACAYRHKKNVAKLLAMPGAVRSSEMRHSPFIYLPFPMDPDWEDMLEHSAAYKEHKMVEKARGLRTAGQWADAKAIYDDVIAANPRSEHAVCGIAKMAFDKGEFASCMDQCRRILSADIAWHEFSQDTVKALSQHAEDRYHSTSHAAAGGALKACGCVVTDRVRLRLRRLPWKFVVSHIVPYIIGEELFTVWKALRHIREASVGLSARVATLAADMPGLVDTTFVKDPAFRSVVAAIEADLPSTSGPKAKLDPPAKLVAVKVVAVADFLMLILKATCEGPNPEIRRRANLGFFDRLRVPPGVVTPTLRFAKDYRIHRASPHVAWTLVAVGEWENDPFSVHHSDPATAAASS